MAGSAAGRSRRACAVTRRTRAPPSRGRRARSPIYKLSPRSRASGASSSSRQRLVVHGGVAGDPELGELAYDDEKGTVGGDLECVKGGEVKAKGTAMDRNINNLQLVPLDRATGEVPTTPSGLAPAGEKLTATKQRETFGHTVAAFFFAVAVVMLVARLFGAAAARLGQPRVMGEVVAGIALGPTILGWISPDLQAALFPSDILPAFGVVANLGLIFYMFLVGLEVDVSQLKGRLNRPPRSPTRAWPCR